MKVKDAQTRGRSPNIRINQMKNLWTGFFIYLKRQFWVFRPNLNVVLVETQSFIWAKRPEWRCPSLLCHKLHRDLHLFESLMQSWEETHVFEEWNVDQNRTVFQPSSPYQGPCQSPDPAQHNHNAKTTQYSLDQQVDRLRFDFSQVSEHRKHWIDLENDHRK